MSKNEMIMLPREVAEHAVASIEILNAGKWTQVTALAATLRAALEQSQGEQEPVTLKPFNTWSSNEGDSWHDFPTDAQIIEDVFGGETPVVGTEYEVSAGWHCVTATYRITWVSEDGDCEAECISHKQENSAPQPDPAPYLYYDPNNGDTWTQEAINDGCCPPDGLIALYTK